MTTTIATIPGTTIPVDMPSLDLNEIAPISRSGSQVIYRLGSGLDVGMIPVLTASHRTDSAKGSTRAALSLRIPIKETNSVGAQVARGYLTTTLTVDTPQVVAGLSESEYLTAILSVFSAIIQDAPGGGVAADPGSFVAFLANGRALK